MRKNILKLGLLMVFTCIQFSIQSQNDDDDFVDIDEFFRTLLIFANQFSLQSQNDDCEMYNRALIWINQRFRGDEIKYYFNIDEIQEKIKKDYFNISFQDNVFKGKDLEYSSTETDSLSCIFDYIKYEFCDREKEYLMNDLPRRPIIDSTEYIRLGIIFSQILYQKEQYAVFYVVVRDIPINTYFYFLFEKNGDKWEIKDTKTVGN